MNDVRIVEAILFASDAPLSPGDIVRADEALDEDRVEAALSALREEYDRTGRAFELREVADGVQLMTRPEFSPYLERFDTVPRSTRLSGPALEALAIVAYRQPISRLEVEYIRGVSSTGVIRTLIDRELITGSGRGEGVGRPILYGTTTRFMEHFGLASMDDLPRPEELPVVLREPEPLEAAEAPESGEPVSSGQDTVDVETDAEAAPESQAGDAPSDPDPAGTIIEKPCQEALAAPRVVEQRVDQLHAGDEGQRQGGQHREAGPQAAPGAARPAGSGGRLAHALPASCGCRNRRRSLSSLDTPASTSSAPPTTMVPFTG